MTCAKKSLGTPPTFPLRMGGVGLCFRLALADEDNCRVVFEVLLAPDRVP